jgi:SAM-dependent methyltransferase
VEEIRCIFCGKDNRTVVLEENGYSGVKCPACDLIYLSPRPGLAEILERYGHDRAVHAAGSIIRDDVSKRLHARHMLRIIKGFLGTGSILEIGAGAGYFLDEARRTGFDVSGIEINPIEANFIRKELNICCESQPLHESSFGGKTFDLVYHGNVLSHLYDPIAEFRKIHDRLRDGGMLVFETGNLGEVKKKYYPRASPFEYPDHLFFFGKKSLRRLVQLTGFELINIYEYNLSWQLLTGKVLRQVARAMSRSRGSEKREPIPPATTLPARRKRTGLIKALRAANAWMSHFLIYKLGSVWLSEGRPETLIVIVRKA